MLGTNDLKERFSVNATDIALSLERLVRVILASGAGPGRGAPGVLLVCPPPIVEVGCLAGMFAGGAAKSQGLAAEVRKAAARVGVPFLDAGEVVTVSPIDGIHYDAEANPALAEAFAAAIRAHFPWMAVAISAGTRAAAAVAQSGQEARHDPARPCSCHCRVARQCLGPVRAGAGDAEVGLHLARVRGGRGSATSSRRTGCARGGRMRCRTPATT